MSDQRDVGATRLTGPASAAPTGEHEPLRGTKEVRRETVVQQDVQRPPVDVAVAVADRRDRVRWGPVWAGLIVAIPTFLLMELIFFSLGWLTLDPGPDEPGSTAGWISGLIGLFAFFLGGLTAGASSMWRGASDGLLHGILVWALGVVAFVFLTLFGGGALFGSLGNVAAQVINLQQAVNLPDVQAQQVLSAARSAASWAVLGLGLSILASGLGGVMGAKMWPRKRDDQQPQTVDVRR